tara:strand:+ start:177 stop:905 length:729 start_codon:yes stop_codon:yes gene_type:complete
MKILNKVTVTGADDKTDQNEMLELTKEFPFVEWGILLSKSAMGKKNRFPSLEWMQKLQSMPFEDHLSGHICGKWIRDICKGEWTILQHEVAEVMDMFQRIQLNFSPHVNKIEDLDYFLSRFGPACPGAREFIFQLTDPNHEIVVKALHKGIDAAAIYDPSGGRGILPSQEMGQRWPVINEYMYAGMAGGLSPDNVKENVEDMGHCSDVIWIDAESGLRTDDWFDLKKVRKFLENTKEYVKDV